MLADGFMNAYQWRADPERGKAVREGILSALRGRTGFRQDPHDARIEQLRVPPHSIEAEQAVLGGLMLAPRASCRSGISQPGYRIAVRGEWPR